MGGDRRDTGPVRLNIARVRLPLTAVVAAWVGRRLAAGVWWVLRRPGAVTVVGLVLVALWVTVAHGPLPVLAVVAVAGSTLLIWSHVHPGSFAPVVVWRARGLWRAGSVYRWAWQPAMVATGLAMRVDGTEYLPRIVSVSSTQSVDRVRVRMLPGQTQPDWATNGQRLAQTFGAVDCRTRSVPGKVHELVLWFLTADPLTRPVAPFEPADPPALKGLPVAKGEDGQIHRVRLLGAHLLVVGATGAGKGSVLWSLINALSAGIRDRLVQVWAIDPKGGMELAAGADMFARFVYGGTPDGGDDTAYEVQFAQVLEDAVTVMRRRQAALRGRARLHTPTTDEPLIVVIIDELASLTAYINDRDAKRRITAALSLLLSQGRAVGVSVVGAVQDPRKDIISMRDLFPTRILLRVTEPEHVALTLGQGARDRGATADLIDDATPGVAYIGQDGVPEAARVRFTHVTDDDITTLVQRYAPRAAALLPGAIAAVS
ncbi:FtsK/SpoIIIE domain-containing protein [Cellulomonas aerilata]|nr:FtsK/SpoIIIE domain-containing protein [Cellulomonas aerilata]